MSRLIDEEKLREDIDNIIIKDMATNLNKKITGDMVLNLTSKIIKCIENQPIAYDVDKVVSELERERDFYYKQMEAVDFENDIFAQHIYEEEHNRGIGLNKAIDIVKAGEIDDN